MSKRLSLSRKELNLYSRQIVLNEIGHGGQLKLKNSRVCLVGLGGLGSQVALQLTAMGVGHIRLVDYDVVEISNLQRQILFNTGFLGYPKVEAAAIALNLLNPYVKIEPLPHSLDVNNVKKIIKDVDVVVDGLDNMKSRYLINRTCLKTGIPYVFGAAIMHFGTASTIMPRKTACLECFQGGLDDKKLPKCALFGVHPSVLGIVASVEVSETVRILLGTETKLANKIFYCDSENLEFDIIKIRRSERCPVCGSRPHEEPKPIRQSLVREVCARKGRVFVVTPKTDLELKCNKVQNIIESKGYRTKSRTNLSLTFSKSSHEFATLLTSGIMIIEGLKNKEESYLFYRNIILNILGVPLSKIE